ncbi:Alpha-tocopherol transfer protein [Taenia solium]|eukprot:TsM_000576400 transcript=TsM_000576400 gene=TsM_000576400
MPKPASVRYTIYDRTKTLSSVYTKRAAKELGEVPEQVSAHLESFRRWLASMPHLKCTTGALTEPLNGFYAHLICWACLGFTREGTMVNMLKSKNYNFDAVPMRDLQGASNMWNDICLVDPRAQIGGMCMIMDLTDFRKEDVVKMFDPKFSKLGTKYFQECLPFRIKKLIYYNMPKIFEAAFNLYSEWLNEKIKSRVLVLGSDFGPAFDAVPGLKELMPDSYGGDNRLSFEDICEEQAKTMKLLPDVRPNFAIAVDESKRPKECKNQFGVYRDFPTDVMGKPGIYVKLNKDEI